MNSASANNSVASGAYAGSHNGSSESRAGTSGPGIAGKGSEVVVEDEEAFRLFYLGIGILVIWVTIIVVIVRNYWLPPIKKVFTYICCRFCQPEVTKQPLSSPQVAATSGQLPSQALPNTQSLKLASGQSKVFTRQATHTSLVSGPNAVVKLENELNRANSLKLTRRNEYSAGGTSGVAPMESLKPKVGIIDTKNRAHPVDEIEVLGSEDVFLNADEGSD